MRASHACFSFTGSPSALVGARGVFFRLLLLVLLAALSACSGDSDEEYRSEGKKLMDQGNPGGAAVLLKSALEKYPADFEIRLHLAQAYIALGKPEQAEVELQKCLRQSPDDPRIYMELARLQLMRNKYDEALASLATLRKNKALTPDSLVLEGIILGLQNRPEQAEASLNEALALEPGKETALIALARVHLARRAPAEALAEVERLLAAKPDSEGGLLLRAEMASRMNDPAKAIECYQAVVRNRPGHEGARYMLALLLLQRGEEGPAQEQLAAMQRQFADSPMTRMLEGLFAYERGDYSAAVDGFQRSVSLQPTLEGYYRLALALMQTGNLESALSNARRVLDFAPEHALARELICTVLLAQGRLDDAQQEAERLAERYPDNAATLFLLGRVQEAKGNFAEAIRLLDRSLALDPDLAGATVRRSTLLMAEGRYSEAEAGLAGAVKRNTGDREAWAALIRFHMERRDFAAAERALTEGLVRRPDDPMLRTLLANLYAAQGKETEALDQIGRVRAADPGNMPAALLELRLHLYANRNEKALELCDALFALYPRATQFLLTSAALCDLAGRADEAQSRLEKAMALGDRRALFFLAQRFQSAGKTGEAEKMLQGALRDSAAPDIRARLASLYLEEKRLDEAIALYESLEKSKPGEAAEGKFHILYAAGKYDEALEQARRLTRLDPGSVAGLALTARCLEASGRRAQALEELQAAYDRGRQTPLLLLMAELCGRAGDLEKAEAYYRTVLGQEKGNAAALAGQASILLSRKKYNEAIAAYEQTLRLNPENPMAANNLAMAYLLAGREPGRALHYAMAAYAQLPENPDVLDTFGMCLLADNRPAEAVGMFERSVLSAPPSASRLYRLADALARAGRAADARATLERALESKSFPERQQAETLLRDLG